MAVAIKLAESTAEAVEERSMKVMQRQLPTYDYEKVFWNSTYSIGLVGLTYVAVKMGQLIMGLSHNLTEAGRIFTDPDKASYDWLYPYCDPEGDKYQDQNGKWIPYPGTHGSVVQYYRDSPEEWEAYKQKIIDKYGEGTDKPSGADAIFKTLDMIGSIFDKYGPIMPLGVVAGHTFIEYRRVERLKGKWTEG